VPWLKMDDQYPSHPKVVAAGGDAAWLHVCAACYCAQHLTDGLVPKAILSRLSDRKKPEQLAARLVEVGLWHDRGDHYELNDYLDYNPSREQVLADRERRAAAGRKGAKNRWHTNGKSHGTSHGESHGTAHGVAIGHSDAPGPAPKEPKGSSRKAERDAIFDALVDVFGTATTPQRQKHYGKCVTQLLSVNASPDDVRARGQALMAKNWDNPSPEALLKWWDTLTDTADPFEALPR
jgi:hypothetical protein